MFKNTAKLLESINKTSHTAEELLSSAMPVINNSIEGTVLETYEEYAAGGYTDRDLALTMKGRVKLSEDNIKKVNNLLNNLSETYPESNQVCPICNKHTIAIGNDGSFCKFCGARLNSNIHFTKEDIGQNAKEIRVKSGKTIKEVAKEINIEVSSISSFENAKRNLSVEAIEKLANIYNVSVNDLLMSPSHGTDTEEDVINEKVVVGRDFDEFLSLDEEGYNLDDDWDSYIFRCPNCRFEVDLKVTEALSLGSDAYDTLMKRTHHNNGSYCKYCGQKIRRPIEVNESNCREEIYRMMVDAAKVLKIRERI